MYTKKNFNGYFYKTKGFYAFFIPIKVPYKTVYDMADAVGLKKKQEFGPILEKGKRLGFGWIGVEIEKPDQPRDDVVYVSGDFEMYEHKGAYKTIGQTYKKIMKEHPGAKDYYNLYLDDPEKIRPEDCRTQIYFR